MTSAFVPLDQDARRRIQNDLSETLVVEAGAGTGKTAGLVERVVALVATGQTTLRHLAAITFTDAAASELRDRIRESLELAAADPSRDEDARQMCAQGVNDLDHAAIETLHSFAAGLLQERPIEAGLPPTLDILSGIASELAFEDEWGGWLDTALDAPDLSRPFLMALSLGLTVGHLHDVARAFHNEYDRLGSAESLADPPPPEARAAQRLISVASKLKRLCAFARKGEEDHLVAHVNGVLAVARRLRETHEPPRAYRLLSRSLPLKTNRGSQRDWETDPSSGINACKRVKALLSELDRDVVEELEQARRSALMPLLRAVRAFALEYASERKRQGRADFHDLLVWARDLLRDNLEVRDHFRERFTHLLIDESQDTDPLQTEIAIFLSEMAEGAADQERPRHWLDVRPQPGRLFLVGDPKQSIYRFRRADIEQMAKVQQLLGAEPVRLVQNFRSQRPVLDWVNHVFGQWMMPGPGQAAYVPLAHRWDPTGGLDTGPRVWRLGSRQRESTVGPVRRREAHAIANLIGRIRGEEWPVMDAELARRTGQQTYLPATYADICILMPQRTGLRALELALEDSDIPFRLEGASLIFATQEVRDLLNCLRAIDDPADQVALVAALRSPALACSDKDLLEFVQGGGKLDYLDPGDCPGGPVSDGLEILRRYHHDRVWHPLAPLIERFLREQRLLEASLGHERPREQWRRYRFVVEQARAFAAAGGRSLRGFLRWADRQVAEGARVTEVPVPEGDEDAVRVMTVHAAKGLEFPVVILTGLNVDRRPRVGAVLFDRESGRVEVNMGRQEESFSTPGYEALATAEGRMEQNEFIRLLYVATTRARDHLVLSVCRTAGDQTSAAAAIESLLEGHDYLWEAVCEGGLGDSQRTPDAGAKLDPAQHSLEIRQAWQEERRRLVADRSRPASVGATTLAHVNKEEAAAAEPWRRGRAGTSIGRAVHAVLQSIDLATGQGLEETCRAQATAEGIPQREGDVARLVRVALRSDVVRRAVASGRMWREVPVAAPIEDGVLEGFIDLLFEEDGRLVIVDYKTDALDKDETAPAMDRYRLQGGSYALALQRSTGLDVKEIIFLFLHPDRQEALTDVAARAREAEEAAITRLGSASHG